TPQGACHILIEDDGVGIDTTLDKDTREDHYGLNIMSERAKRINGKLKIESEPGEGTRITLTFKYSSNTKPPKQTNTSNSGVVVQLPSAQSKS
ncbi:MAG: hypothetical protein PVG75_11240, partial [Thioalkalispiraceae bacterium]